MPCPAGLDVIAAHPDFAACAAGAALRLCPLGFVDVGARGGVHDLVEPLARHVAVLGFEPDQKECDRLTAMPEVSGPWAAFHLEPVALAGARGPATLHLLSASTNHSLRPPSTAFTSRYAMEKWIQIGAEPLITDTLDNVLFDGARTFSGQGEFLKLDTQGTEHEILEGAARTLEERTVAVMLEVAFCELYQGQKLFSEVELLLRGHGFSFYGFHGNRIHTRSRKLLDKRAQATAERAMFADAIFFKDPLPGTYARRPASAREQHALFVCALLLGFYDFALELALATWAAQDAAEQARIRRLVLTLSTLDPAGTLAALQAACREAEAAPAQANLIAGRFVDRQRHHCDYDDVFNVSSLPAAYQAGD
jgi:FkbM family methyltransferase